MFLTYILLIIIAGVNSVNINIPVDFNWDSTLFFVNMKSFFMGEWGLFDTIKNSRLSAPIGLDFGAFPTSDINLMIIFIKLISLFHKNYIGAINIYYFLTFFLTTGTSLFVLRKLRVPNSIAIVASLLYSFMPFHFLREIKHLVIASYYLVPLMSLVLIYMWSKKPLFFKKTGEKWRFDCRNKKAIFTFVTIVLVCLGAIYYAVFFMFFVLITGLSAWFYRKNIHHILCAVIILGTLFICTIANFAPNITYAIKHPSANFTQRDFAQTEYFGLRVAQMLLPIDNHRFVPFAKLKNNFNKGLMFKNESSMAALGIIFASCTIFLIFNFLFIRKNRFTIYDKMGFLTISSILLTVAGGFLTFFAFFGFTQIRSCNRISIFIAFFAVIAAALILKKIKAKMKKKDFNLILVLVLLFGIFDQTSLDYNYAPRQIIIKKEIESMKDMMSKIENITPENAMIYQLPFVPFPEGTAPGAMFDYDNAKPSIFTNKLRFSYGAIKGNDLSRIYEAISFQNAENIVKNLKQIGFSGILINIKGYPEYPKEYLKFDKILGTPIVSKDKTQIYYSLK